MRSLGSIVMLLSALRSVPALWPAPSQYTTGAHYVRLHDSFSIVLHGTYSIPEDLRAAIATAEYQIKNDNMVPLKVDLDNIEEQAKKTEHIFYFLNLHLNPDTQSLSMPSRRNTGKHTIIQKAELESTSNEINKPFEERDESYTLEVNPGDPVANLTASTALGFLRGLQTFTQMVYTTSGSSTVRYIRDAPISIVDKPAYPVRGILLDTARNYYPAKDIKRTLDAMSYSKMN